ncbi:hypothetical protein Agub_g11450 [Astrephomene gubernaculifera]|uniref:Cyclin N-terminal domain-containing protein n=1 Tax=Astrephomene gubernaculifera TaxID=47775 RepID=A0AAD3HQH5_9CHLO|nr:hypothetical protein Agub_g11450 [Astrephomene gubernaculifera]
MQTKHIGDAAYFTRAQLEATNPSRREGIDAVAEARWRSTTSKLVKTAIKTLKLPDWVYETSMNYINRFFLTRSISKNDRHLVVGGAILLASKVQESPRSVQDVAYVLLQLKNANKQKPQQGPDQTTLEQFMEGVVLAEQAMLFSMNFNLNVETHVSLARRLLEPLDLWAKTNPTPEEAEANQLKLGLYSAMTFFLNDSALTNLSLQYPNSKVAPVALVMAAKRIVALRYAGKEIPAQLQRVLALANDAEWFASKGLTLETAAGIESQINELYATAPAAPASNQQQQQRQQQQQASQAVRSQQVAASASAQPQQQQAPASASEASRQQQQHQTQQPQAAGALAAPQRPSDGGSGCDGVGNDGRGAPASCPDGQTQQQAAGAATSSGLPVAAPMMQQQTGHMEEATSAGHLHPNAPDACCCAAPQAPGSPPAAAADHTAAATATPSCKREEQQQHGYDHEPRQPTSSAAAGPPAAGAMAGGTPEQPHPPSPHPHPHTQSHQHSPSTLHQHPAQPHHQTPPLQPQQQPLQPQQQQPCSARKRISDGDECLAGEQQATSELHPSPQQQQQPLQQQHPEQQHRHDGGGNVGGGMHEEDSAIENCSPNGLTTGNASGSGCGHAEGQPEVCSRADALSQQQQQQRCTGGAAAAGVGVMGCSGQYAAGQVQQPQQQQEGLLRGGKRGRMEGEPSSELAELEVHGGSSGVEGRDGCMLMMMMPPAFKARRLEEAGAA